MLKKLLNFTKKNEFFLELDEDEDLLDKAKAVATKAKEKTAQIVEEVKETVAESSTVEKATSETKEIAQKAQAKANEAASQLTKDSSKKLEKEASAKDSKKLEKEASAKDSKKPEKEEAATAPVDTSYSEEPFWVKLMYKTSGQQEAEEKAEKTFATDYLITKPKSRRRPGGSLDKFKTMASQTKTKL